MDPRFPTSTNHSSDPSSGWFACHSTRIDDPERDWPRSLDAASLTFDWSLVRRPLAAALVLAGDRLVRTGETLRRSAERRSVA